jgi:hypothetical protein
MISSILMSEFKFMKHIVRYLLQQWPDNKQIFNLTMDHDLKLFRVSKKGFKLHIHFKTKGQTWVGKWYEAYVSVAVTKGSENT